MPMQFLVVKVIFPYGFVFTELVSQIDQKINKLVAEQQKVDAQCAHCKSEIEELKQDIDNSNKQKKLFSNALAKKVTLNFSDSIGSCL
jgi:archaellum component FlaC